MTQILEQSLEQQVTELNEHCCALAQRSSAQLGAWFERSGDHMSNLRRVGLLSIGDRLPVPPALLPRTAWQLLGALHGALRLALDEIFRNRCRSSWTCLADDLRLDEDTRRYLDRSRSPGWLTIARPDVVLQGDRFRIVEPNAGSSCGAMPDADILGRLFESAPVIGDYLRSVGARRPDGMATMASLLRSRLARAGFEADSLLVVAEFADELADPAFYHCEAFAAELRRHGMRAEVAAIEDLDVTERGVSLAGRRCGLVYRMCAEQPDPAGHLPALGPLVDAGRRGVVAVSTTSGTRSRRTTTILAVLSEEMEHGRLSPALDRRLAGFVPWTRLLEPGTTTVDGATVDLLAWCIAHQEDLVLKPGAGFQGRGVTLGCEITPADWSATVDRALAADEPWLVQRLQRSDPHPVSVARDGKLVSERTFVDWGYYAVGGCVPSAAIRRSSPPGTFTRRIKQAGITPVFIV